MIRVFLVHDECLLRSALADWLAREGDLDVFDAPWHMASKCVRSLSPDVCVADLSCSDPYDMPPLEELPLGLGAPDRPPPDPGPCRLLVLGTANRPGPLRRAVEARALGYLNKEGSPEQLVTAVRAVAKGERFVDTSLGFTFLRAAQIPLTQRELTVLSLAAAGASFAEIASSLHLSNGTVRNYMAAITRKTGARNRIDAIRICRAEGWV
ncbi:response regulator transcription factor [Streptomyces sp. NBC_00457]|uniref:response regulator transcription factor n=1 Tax=unclassified Streptomyces TaxID=2593676 RepID=UPI002E1DEC86|nr:MULTISPECIES: response regulator transcription factor [unclassified Streptomyces]